MDQLGPVIRDLCLAPILDLSLHRLKIALNPVHAYGEPVDQVHFGSIYPDPTPLNII